MATTDTPIQSPDLDHLFFYPTDDEWRREHISLIDYKDASKATFIFRYTSGLGGCINIDNIRFGQKEVISVEEKSLAKHIVCPNPADEKTKISLNLETPGQMTITMFDLLGNKVMDIFDGYVLEGLFVNDVDLNTLSSGIYMIEIHHGRDRIVVNIIVE